MNNATQTKPDLSLDDAINTADMFNQYVNNWIVAPLANMGIGGFVFDIGLEDKIELTSDITDHYVEKNVAIQDHIALKPITITMRGYIGELTHFNSAQKKSNHAKLGQKLTTLNSFLPIITDAAKNLQAAATQAKGGMLDAIDAGVGAGVDIYGAYKKLQQPKTKQEKAFYFFKALWQARQLVAVQTPQGGFFNNMAIVSLVAMQPEHTNKITDFSVTLKEIRKINTKIKKYDPKAKQGRNAGQSESWLDKGKAGYETVKKSASDFVSNILKK